MLTQFVKLVTERREGGESMATIGRDLGVSKQAVAQWISGKTTPSKTVLLLAELLMRAPREMADGLPGDGRRGVSCPSKGRRDG